MCTRYNVKTFDMPPGCNITITLGHRTSRCVALFRVSFQSLQFHSFEKCYPSQNLVAQTYWSSATRSICPTWMRQIAREEMSWLSNLMSTNPKGLNLLFQVFLVSSLFRFCNRDFPVYNYPGMSHAVTGSGKMKIWFTLQAVKGMTSRQERRSNWRAMCTVYCREGTALWHFLTPFVKLRSRSQVRSRSGPGQVQVRSRSGPRSH